MENVISHPLLTSSGNFSSKEKKFSMTVNISEDLKRADIVAFGVRKKLPALLLVYIEKSGNGSNLCKDEIKDKSLDDFFYEKEYAKANEILVLALHLDNFDHLVERKVIQKTSIFLHRLKYLGKINPDKVSQKYQKRLRSSLPHHICNTLRAGGGVLSKADIRI